MPEPTQIPDQDDVLAKNERLEADNTRLTGELKAATEDLAVQVKAASDAAGLAARATAAETAARVAGEELARLKADNTELTAKMADFNKAVAAEVVKLGLNPKAAEHKQAPTEKDLTPTQRVLAAKGIGSIAELRK